MWKGGCGLYSWAFASPPAHLALSPRSVISAPTMIRASPTTLSIVRDRLQGTAHYVPDRLSRPPPFDEDYHQEPAGPDRGLEERDLDRREVYERVLDEHQDS
jgi:hypothetical protein